MRFRSQPCIDYGLKQVKMEQMQQDVDSAAQTEAHSRSASSPSNVTPHDGTVTPPDGVIPAANRGPVRAMLI